MRIAIDVGHLSIAAKSRQAVEEFWEYVAFFANSLIFLLIGMRVAIQNFKAFLPAAIAAILLVMLARAFGAASAYSLLGWFTRRAGACSSAGTSSTDARP